MLTLLYSSRFARKFKKLSRRLQEQVLEKESVFRHDPFDARLKTHKLHGELSDCWSFSIDYDVRIIFSFEEEGVVRMHTIGGHDIYL
jgi:mRNA-degrading endonuclease YafQ of YafQ-DinJ toxin-antitoxin module